MTRNFTTAITVYGHSLGHGSHNHDDNDVLSNWNSALGSRLTKGCDVVVVGDSVTERGAATAEAASFVSHLARLLQRAYNPPGTPGGAAYQPCGYSALMKLSISDEGNWAFGTGTTKDQTMGLGHRATILTTSAAQSATWVGECDRVWIMYTQRSDSGGMKITIDGGTPTIVGTNNGTQKSGRVWDSGMLGWGVHTVVVVPDNTLAAPNNVFKVVVDGIKPFLGDGPVGNSFTAGGGTGVRVWNGGHAGWAPGNYVGTGNTNWRDGFDNIDPDLVLVALSGLNDYTNAVAVSTFKSNLTTLLSDIQGAATHASVAVVLEPRLDTAPNQTAYDLYLDATRSVAEAAGAGVIDVRSGFGRPTAATDMIGTDQHPTDAGMRYYAETISRYLGGDESQRYNPVTDSYGAVSATGYSGGVAAPLDINVNSAQNGFGVISGLAVTASATPSMVVNVAAGQWSLSFSEQAASAATTYTIANNTTNFVRYDLIDTGGMRTGTATPYPVVPAAGLFQAALAVVVVPPGATAIGGTQIIDRRCYVSSRQVFPKTVTTAFTATSSTSFANVSGLAFNIAANDTWTAEGCLFVSGSASGDIKLQFTGPASPTGIRYGFRGFDVAATTSTGAVATSALTDATAAAFSTSCSIGLIGTGSTVTLIPFWLHVRNGSTAGTIQLQAAQVTSNGTATSVLADSYMVCTRG